MSDFGGWVFILSFLALLLMMVAWEVQYHRVRREIADFEQNRPVHPEYGEDPFKPQMF